MENQEKLKIKGDIKKIRAAKLRARFGITKESIRKTETVVNEVGGRLKKMIFGMGKFALALGESANDYQKQQDKKFKRIK